MKRTLLAAALLALLFVAAHAQQPKVYRWDPKDPNCSNYTRDDALVTTMRVPEATVIVTLLPPRAAAQDLEKYLVFSLTISNEGDKAFTVQPDAVTLTVIDKKTTTLAPLPLSEVAKKIRNQGSGFFIGIRPTRSATATVTDPNGNVSTVRVRVPDEAAEAAQARAGAERRARQEDRAEKSYELGLKANTLFKGQDTFGAIFFEKKKALSDGGFVLNIPLGDFTVEIPFGKARTGQ